MRGQIALVDGTTHPRQQTIVATIGTLGTAFAVPAGIVVVLTQHLALLFLPMRRFAPNLRRLWGIQVGVSWAAILVGIAILIPAVRKEAASPTGLMKWQATYSFRQRAIEAFGETFGFVIPHDANRFWPDAGNDWLAAALLTLMALGLAANWRRPTHKMMAVTAIGTPILFALIGLVSASAGRYLIGMLPAVVLLAAAGVSALLRERRIRVPAAALLALAFGGLSLQALDTLVSERKYDWRPVAAFLDRAGLTSINILSDAPQSEQVVGHYLAAADTVTFETINPAREPLDRLWLMATGRRVTWLLLVSGETPPETLTDGITVCRWPFREMTFTMIARESALVPASLRGCDTH
jgi:hypothetical protein